MDEDEELFAKYSRQNVTKLTRRLAEGFAFQSFITLSDRRKVRQAARRVLIKARSHLPITGKSHRGYEQLVS